MRKVLIFGAISAIAEATARLLARHGDSLHLVGRNGARLEAVAHDLRLRGAARVECEQFDANDFVRHAALLDRAEQGSGGLDAVLIAHGTLSDQAASERSAELTLREFETNALSVVSILTHVANRFEAQKSGTIVVIYSVAGDRGRAVNYVYGAAKAAVSTFLSGLRQRLYATNVRVLTIKPGFVDTPMTSSFRKGPLWASPERVARDIVNAMARRNGLLYTPWFWAPIMYIIRTRPERIFMRMRF
jgi:short-subunit dehydrogenase